VVNLFEIVLKVVLNILLLQPPKRSSVLLVKLEMKQKSLKCEPHEADVAGEPKKLQVPCMRGLRVA
jgi:hypothetical protein